MKDFTHIDITNIKVKSIILAGLEVFSKNDYEKASTNMIVKKAGIPRGVLYYHFKNKEELFEFLIYYSEEIFLRDLDKKINWEESDYLNRIKDTIIIKLQIISQYPFLLEFIEKVSKNYNLNDVNYINKSDEFRKRIMEDNLDYSTIKENVDVSMLKKLSYYSISGEISNIIKNNGLKSLSTKKNEIIKAIDNQIAFYKKHFYE